jgi:hypothetical protein
MLGRRTTAVSVETGTLVEGCVGAGLVSFQYAGGTFVYVGIHAGGKIYGNASVPAFTLGAHFIQQCHAGGCCLTGSAPGTAEGNDAILGNNTANTAGRQLNNRCK